MAFTYHIELTNVCDLRCAYCPSTTSERSKGFMTEVTYRKIVAHMQRLSPLNFMILHHFGEPLLHPDLPGFVEIANRARLNPGFSTNGEKMTEEKFRELLRHGLKWLCVAFHSPRGEAVFHQLRDIAKEHRLLYWGRECVTKPTPYEPNAILEYGIERQVLHSFAGAVAPEEPAPPGWTPPCDYLRRNFVCILHDGRVVPCAMDEQGRYVLGSVDDLDTLRNASGYELCRTCQGFVFAEGFRAMMRQALDAGAHHLDAAGWVDPLEVCDFPESEGDG